VQVAPGDLDVAVFGQLAPAELAFGDALETRSLKVVRFNTPLGSRPLLTRSKWLCETSKPDDARDHDQAPKR
jgi:hypothetical protein